MKRRIIAAESKDSVFDDTLKSLQDDFDYIISGLEKLARSGPNAENAASAIAENIGNDLSKHISDIADQVS